MSSSLSNFEARSIIETLRSGVPSRNIGRIFATARQELLDQISDRLDGTVFAPGGMVLLGKYGEGKTHLLNTVFAMARKKNMVVSMATLSKETPMDKLYHIYTRLMANTYLPERSQPGIGHLFEKLGPEDPIAKDLLLYAGEALQIDKLYYLLKALLNTEVEEERFELLSDLEGNLHSFGSVKTMYRRISQEPASSAMRFVKSRHMMDYFNFMSFFFRSLGYSRWVLLFDEAELIGQLGKKARINAYANMAKLLANGNSNIFSLFVFNASYRSEVIEGKHEVENLIEQQPPHQDQAEIERIIDLISGAPQLATVSDAELLIVVEQIRLFHGQAYAWNPAVETELLLASSDVRKPLRTRIRIAVEMLDQLYLYGHTGSISISDLVETAYTEEIPYPEELEQLGDEEEEQTIPQSMGVLGSR